MVLPLLRNKYIMTLILTVILCSVVLTTVNAEFENFFEKNEAIYSIGNREEGDELLIKDVLKSSSRKENGNNSITFHYPINNRIVTYIELGSDSNVGFEFSLGVTEEENGGYLTGTVTALEPKFFIFKISVFGFERTEDTKNIDSILVPKLLYQSKVEPKHIEDHYLDENDADNVITIGNRQPGDRLLHKEKKSSGISDIRLDHSVTFYYVDSNYVTCAIFTAITTSTLASATYSHMSPHSLKVTINDFNVFELNADMEIYGYEPEEKPDEYEPPLPESAIDPNLEGIKLQSLSDDVELIENLAENILAPENLCNANNANSNFVTMVIILNLFSVSLVLINRY